MKRQTAVDPSDQPSARVHIDLHDRGYDVIVRGGVLAEAGRHIAPLLRERRVFLVTDDIVADLHLATVTGALDDAGIGHELFVLPAGENSKSYAQIEELLEGLFEKGVERGSMLAALGGGVVGDITGFAASIALRGLDFVQMPTTLLAQVDSSVGGKTGINARHGKNLVGSFHQPRLVLADTATLDTLPRRQLLAGYAEVVKYGLIGDAGFFAWLEENGQALIDGDDDARRHAIETSCRAKATIVAADEREAGSRALLNLGHTFGHALEAEAHYDGRVLHGEAVAVGLVLAFDLSAALGLCPQADADRVRAHLDSVGLPTTPSALGSACDPSTLLSYMSRDKKVRDGAITFVLARGIGQAFLTTEVSESALGTLFQHAAA